MAITLQTAGRNLVCDAIVDLADAGAGAATIQLATTAFGTILATITCSDPAYGAASTGQATLSGTPLTDSSADNTGTAAVWRLRDSNSVEVMQGPAATSGGGDITLSTNARNAACDALGNALNSGDIQFASDSGFTSILATLPLNADAFAAASGGSAAMSTSPAPTANASAAGTAGFFRFRQSDTTELFRGTVGTSGADINFATGVVWGVGTPVTLTSYSITQAATIAASDGAMVVTSTSVTAGQSVSITSGSFNQPAS